jgi:hypothetical protein
VPNESGGLRLEKRVWDDACFPALIEAAAAVSARLHEPSGVGVRPASERVELAEIKGARAAWGRRNAFLVVVALTAALVPSIVLQECS